MSGDAVFLTGGSGFVGAHVATALLENGYEVRALVRSEAAVRRLPAGCAVVRGDVGTPGELVRDIDGCRYLVHTAAVYTFDRRRRAEIELINVRGTAGLLEAARLAGVERALVTSSSATVGPVREDRPADDRDWADATPGPHGRYHESKLRQERAAAAARLPVVTVLPTTPIGPGDWRPTPTGQMVVDYMRGRMFGYLSGGMNVVAVEDVAAGHVLALRGGVPGRRYLLGGENLSLLGIFERLALVTGVPAPRRRLPFWLAKTAGHLLPRVPLEGVEMGRERMWVDWGRVRLELGYEPRHNATEALAGAVRWYREHGYAA